MNNNRRKRLEKAISLLNEAWDVITDVRDEELDAWGNLPEGLQESEKGELLYENYETLDSHSDSICDMIDEINDIIG